MNKLLYGLMLLLYSAIVSCEPATAGGYTGRQLERGDRLPLFRTSFYDGRTLDSRSLESGGAFILFLDTAEASRVALCAADTFRERLTAEFGADFVCFMPGLAMEEGHDWLSQFAPGTLLAAENCEDGNVTGMFTDRYWDFPVLYVVSPGGYVYEKTGNVTAQTFEGMLSGEYCRNWRSYSPGAE